MTLGQDFLPSPKKTSAKNAPVPETGSGPFNKPDISRRLYISSTYQDYRDFWIDEPSVMRFLDDLNCTPSWIDTSEWADDAQTPDDLKVETIKKLFEETKRKEYALLGNHLKNFDIMVVIHSDRDGIKKRHPVSIRLECLLAERLGIPILVIVHSTSKIRRISELKKIDPQEAITMAILERVLKEKSHDYSILGPWDSVAHRIELSIRDLIKNDPPLGWCRVATLQSTTDENTQLKRENASLSALLKDLQESQLSEPKVLSYGYQSCTFRLIPAEISNASPKEMTLVVPNAPPMEFSTTWNEIFMHIGPSLINEASTEKLKEEMEELVNATFATKHEASLPQKVDKREDYLVTEYILKNLGNHFIAPHDFMIALNHGKILTHLRRENKAAARKFKVQDYDFKTVIIQFLALDLIQKSEQKKSLTDHETYWTLTQNGRELLIKLRAVYYRQAA